MRPRMGQGHFKRAVAAAYANRCAITRALPSPAWRLNTSDRFPGEACTGGSAELTPLAGYDLLVHGPRRQRTTSRG
jgi:hypothetical protein